MNKTQRILMRAAKLIEERGWAQGWFTNKRGCLCMAGAINAVGTGLAEVSNNDSMEAWHVLFTFLDDNPANTNDNEYTDPTQAIAALTGAAMMEI